MIYGQCLPPATLAHLLSVVSARQGLGDRAELSSLQCSAGRGLGTGECSMLPACGQRLPVASICLRPAGTCDMGYAALP